MWHSWDSDFRDEHQSRVYPRLAGCEDHEQAENDVASETKMIIPDLSLLTDEEFDIRMKKMRDDHQLTLELCNKLGICEKEEVLNMRTSLPVAVVDDEFTLSTVTFTDKSPIKSPDFVRKNFKANKVPSSVMKAKSANLSPKKLRTGIAICDTENEENDIAEYKLKKYLDGLDYAKEVYRKTSVDKNGVPKHSCTDMMETVLENNKNLSKVIKKDWKHRVTIPKPFQMTVREMSKGTLKTKAQESWEKEKESREQSELEECQKTFKAAPLPANTYIALYEELQKKSAKQRQENHLLRQEFLLADQSPFTFIEREKKKQAERHDRLKRLKDADMKRPDTNFRAKPFPKKIFDDGVYEKMRNEEEMRLLRMDVRASELLRSSSSPESMRMAGKKHRCPLSEAGRPHCRIVGTDVKGTSDTEAESQRSRNKETQELQRTELRRPATHLSANLLSRSFSGDLAFYLGLSCPVNLNIYPALCYLVSW